MYILFDIWTEQRRVPLISRLIPKLETEFDSEFQERYCEELQDYDDSKLIEFAHRYQLNITEDDIDSVTEAIAELYASILKNVSTKKRSKPIVSEGNLKSDKNSIVLSYTFTEPEKQALVRLCELIKTDLRRVKQQSDKICDKKHELNNLTTSEANERWKPHLESDIKSSEKRFNEAFTKLEKLCTDLVNLLKPKTDMDAAFPKLISFANNIGNDEYISTNENKWK